MACNITSFILRIAFLGFFALNAWNTLADMDNFHPAFTKSLKEFETTFAKRTGHNFPHFMTSAHVQKHSEFVSKTLAWTQLGLAVAGLMLWSGFISLVGLLYLLTTLIQLNVAKLNMGTKLTDLEPFVLAIGLFAASLVMSCNRKTCEKATSAMCGAKNTAGKNAVSSGKKK